MVDHVAASFDSTRFLNVVGRDREYGTTVHSTRGNNVCFGLFLAACFWTSRFGHDNNIKQAFPLPCPPARATSFPTEPVTPLEFPSAMLPGMAGNLRVAIVGAGKLGTVLAISLRRAGFPIDAVIARARGESLKKAKKLAKQVGGRALVSAENLRADLAWFCVPDSEIAAAAHDFALQGSWKYRIVFHSSGALSSDELDSLRAAGASVASVHPLMTFVRSSRPSFGGV